MKTHIVSLRIGGIITALFSVFHLLFYWLFEWQTALAVLDADTWAIFHCFNVCINAMFILFSYLSLCKPHSLLQESSGRIWLVFMVSIYSIRIVCEFVLWGFQPAQSSIIIVMCLLPIIFYTLPLVAALRQTYKS